MNLLINGVSAKSGGGLTIFLDFLEQLSRASGFERSVVVYPPDAKNIVPCTQDIDRFVPKSRSLLKFQFMEISQVCKQNKIDVVLNLSDIPTISPVPELYFFDWAYACYPESVVWKRMKFRDYWHRVAKLALIRRTIHRPKMITVQIPSMEQRLRELYGIRNCRVIPSPVSIPSDTTAEYDVSKLRCYPEQKLLFYPAAFTPHKNHQVLVEVAKLWKMQSKPYRVALTIDARGNPAASSFMSRVEKEGLSDFIVNLGPLPHQTLLAAYRKMDALLMPTLLESYGLPLVEAMMADLPIFVSDFPFTRDVCQEAAYYFDPLMPASICDSVDSGFHNHKKLLTNVANARHLASNVPTKQQWFDSLMKCLEEIA